MSHDHGFSAAGENRKRLAIVFSMTASFVVVEAVAGYFTKSLALLADAGHMLTDAGALGLALLAIWFGGKPATKRKTFGFYRMEILAAFINALVLLLISFYILYEAWQRFKNPPEIQSKQMLIVAVLGLGVNLISMKLLSSHSEKSLNVRGAYLEVLSDMLGSIGVIAASLIMLTTKWYYADPIISAGIGLFIVPRTWTLLNQAIHILLEGTPEHVDLKKLEDAMLRVKGVKTIHDLHVWTITSGVDSLSAHVIIEDANQSDRILKELQKIFEDDFKISHTTVQLEADACKESGHI